MKHEELLGIVKDNTPDPKPKTPRKMITCSIETHDKIKEIADELDSPISRVVEALVDFYLDSPIED